MNMAELSNREIDLKKTDFSSSLTKKCESNVSNPNKHIRLLFYQSLERICSLRIEPIMLLFMFSCVLSSTSLTKFIMDKGCILYYNYSSDICENLHNSSNREQKENVEMLANNYNLYLNLLSPIGAFIVIFLAPWSDRFGRKPPLIYGLLGFFLNDLGLIVCTVYFHSGLEYIIVSSLFIQLSGGFICVSTILYSHACEVSAAESRSLKYTFLQIASELGVTLGALTGSFLYTYYSYMGVFLAMTLGHFLAIVWTILGVPETRGIELHVSFKQKINALFTSQNLTDGIKISLKKRRNRGRYHLWLLLFSSCSFALTYVVYTNINYVFAHHMYAWDPTIYSEYWALFSLSELLVFLACSSIFIKIFKLSDPLIGFIGSISIIGKSIFLAFASDLRLYYLSNIFGFLHGLGNLAISTLISKLVIEEELGRIFSLLKTFECVLSVLGSVIVAKVFNATLHVFPGACYICATFFLTLPLGTFIYALLSGSFQSPSSTNL